MRKGTNFSLVVLLTALLVVSSLVGGVLATPATAAADESNSIPQITVTGRGTVNVSPDQAKISLGVLTMATTAREAQQANATLTTSIIKSLVAIGIPREKITTQEYSIWPEYSYPKADENKPPAVVDYRVTNTVIVTLEDTSKVGEVIDTAVQAGANQVQSIQFLKKDSAQALRQALQLACQDGRLKASAIADALGVQIIGIASVQENSSITPSPILYNNAKMEKGIGSAPTPIQPGDLQVNGNVNIVFRIK